MNFKNKIFSKIFKLNWEWNIQKTPYLYEPILQSKWSAWILYNAKDFLDFNLGLICLLLLASTVERHCKAIQLIPKKTILIATKFKKLPSNKNQSSWNPNFKQYLKTKDLWKKI